MCKNRFETVVWIKTKNQNIYKMRIVEQNKSYNNKVQVHILYVENDINIY